MPDLSFPAPSSPPGTKVCWRQDSSCRQKVATVAHVPLGLGRVWPGSQSVAVFLVAQKIPRSCKGGPEAGRPGGSTSDGFWPGDASFADRAGAAGMAPGVPGALQPTWKAWGPIPCCTFHSWP